jgi:hypothetical protein
MTRTNLRAEAGYWLLFVLLLWTAHAIGYLVHEYAHSFTAWALGYKANPLALNYGHLSFGNIVLLSDIDENVDYDPIFAAGKGSLASLIAVAGVLFGNGLCYLASRKLYSFAKEHARDTLALFCFLLCLMCVGNFLSYVPVRTFTTHADMFTVEKGLSISPWWVAVVLGVPFAIAIWHFFARLLPDARTYLFPGRILPQILLTVLSCYAVFDFFGLAGMHRYGAVSHWMSMVSLFVFFPVSLILCWPRGRRGEALSTTNSSLPSREPVV